MSQTQTLLLPTESYQYTVEESQPVASVVAKLRAADEDEGSNAEMDYRIVDGDGPNMFNITTDEETQDGVIILQKVDPLKQSFQMLELQ